MSSKGLSYDVARNMVEGWRIKAILSILTTFIHPYTLHRLSQQGVWCCRNNRPYSKGLSSCSWTAEEEDATPGLPEEVWGLD